MTQVDLKLRIFERRWTITFSRAIRIPIIGWYRRAQYLWDPLSEPSYQEVYAEAYSVGGDLVHYRHTQQIESSGRVRSLSLLFVDTLDQSADRRVVKF